MRRKNNSENIDNYPTTLEDEELADKTEQFEFGIIKKSREKMMDSIDKEYFKGFLDELDELKKTTDIPKIEKLLDINIDSVEALIDHNLSTVVDKINESTTKDGVEMIPTSSFYDILTNSVLTGISSLIWIIKNIDNKNSKIQEKIQNPDSVKRQLIEKHFKNMLGKDGDITYYLDELCNDTEKMDMEISSEVGFIQKFKEYFTKDFKNLTGSKKLPYFKFFSELTKGNINEKNIDEYLKTIDEDYINIEKIIEYIKNQ